MDRTPDIHRMMDQHRLISPYLSPHDHSHPSNLFLNNNNNNYNNNNNTTLNPSSPFISSSTMLHSPSSSSSLSPDSVPPRWFHIVERAIIISLALLCIVALWRLCAALSEARSSASNSKGQIKLPSSSPRKKADRRKTKTKKQDVFEKITGNLENVPDDEGEVLDEGRFWRRTACARYVALFIPLVALAFQAFQAFQYQRRHSTPHGSLPLSFNVSHLSHYATLLIITFQIILTAILALRPRFETHRTTISWTFSLCLAHAFEQYVSHLGPSLFGIRPMITHATLMPMGFSVVLMLWIGFIPQGPGRYIDKRTLYTRAVRMAMDEKASKVTGGIGSDDRNVDGGQDDEWAEMDLGLVDPRNNEEEGEGENVLEEESTNMFASLSCVWVLSTMSKAARFKQVDVQDLPVCPPSLRMQPFIRQIAGQPTPTTRWAFCMAMWSAQRRALFLHTFLQFARMPLWYIPHYCLQQLLISLETRDNVWTSVSWAVMLLSFRLLNMLTSLQTVKLTDTNITPRLGMHARYLIFSKLFTRNTYANTEGGISSRADILNLISSDVGQVSQIIFTFSGLLRDQLEMIIGGVYVWLLLGPSGLWGLSTLLITNVPAYFLTKMQYKLFEKRISTSDERVSLMQEAIQAISMIKMMAAEKFWYRRISEVRDREFKMWFKASLLGSASSLLYSFGPTLLLLVSFAHYTLIAKKPLTPSIAFTSILVFDELRPILFALPDRIADLLQEFLSAKRLVLFLGKEDLQYLDQPADRASASASKALGSNADADVDVDADADADLYMRGTLGWTDDEDGFRLQDLDVTFPRGQLTLVAGKFGSGKTLMLLGLLGEAKLIEGDISYAVSDVLCDASVDGDDAWDLLPRGVAYVPQTAWLQSQSIRANILFGLPLDMERYRKVLFAVCLMPDLNILEDADLTEIGERGKILSGGQKARVSLARAVYSRAPTVILDDVISAVDATTSQHIIEHCFKSDLMRDRTVIIASHAVEAIGPIAEHAIFLEDNRVVFTGKGSELLSSEYMAHLRSSDDGESTSGAGAAAGHTPAMDEAVVREQKGEAETFEVKHQSPKTPRQLLIDDHRAEGAIKWERWTELMTFNGGVLFWVMSFGLLFLTRAGGFMESKTLEWWTADNSSPSERERSMHLETRYWVILYSAISMFTLFVNQLKSFWSFYGGYVAMKRVHNEMLEAMLRTKMIFFTKTRAGSIVQRFGRDLSDISSCSFTVDGLFRRVLSLAVSISTVAYFSGWPFAGLLLAVIILGIKPLRWYRSCMRQIRRLDSIIPGPINAMYGETIAGSAVIRAHGAQSVMLNELLGMLNMRICVHAWRYYVGRWTFFTFQTINLAIVALAIVTVLLDESISAATAGFLFTFSSSISGMIQFLVINIRDMELDGISLERTTEYRHLEREEDESTDPTKPAPGRRRRSSSSTRSVIQRTTRRDPSGPWPSAGSIVLNEMSASYGPDMPEILHEVSFSIEGGSRVGIVGASGGGKSTLAKSLFSFVDVTHGKIEIDGEDRLRSSLGIIAQDPILLSGSLRLNLDIEGQYEDAQLYEALRMVQLIKVKGSRANSRLPSRVGSQLDVSLDVDASGSETSSTTKVDDERQVFENLDFEIKSGGENLSAGQKQLIVLARALIRKHKILIMDEATASIDSATDQAISKVVHEGFKDSTVLIIAHRLRTIIPCSKILVMDKGCLVQQGHPLELIRENGGKFQELCMASGEEEYKQLVALAESEARKSDGDFVQLD